MSTF
jgi:DNA-binding XRE family transcriptional regulator